MKNIIFLSFTLFLTACTGNLKEFFEPSINGKWIDTQGPNAGKRLPRFNSKYIEKALANVQDYSETSSDENEDNTEKNRKLYYELLQYKKLKPKKAEAKQISCTEDCAVRIESPEEETIATNFSEGNYISLKEVPREEENFSFEEEKNTLIKEIKQLNNLLSEARETISELKKYNQLLGNQLPVNKSNVVSVYNPQWKAY